MPEGPAWGFDGMAKTYGRSCTASDQAHGYSVPAFAEGVTADYPWRITVRSSNASPLVQARSANMSIAVHFSFYEAAGVQAVL